MYDYVLSIKQPPPVIPASKPETPPKKEVKVTRAQARAKKDKERDEVRAWWADLPEEKRQEIRSLKYPLDPKDKKKPEKKPGEKVKIIKIEVQVEKPGPAKAEEKGYVPKKRCKSHRRPGKPNWESYQGPQQWAIAEI